MLLLLRRLLLHLHLSTIRPWFWFQRRWRCWRGLQLCLAHRLCHCSRLVYCCVLILQRCWLVIHEDMPQLEQREILDVSIVKSDLVISLLPFTL
jgi:hypothetical protein